MWFVVTIRLCCGDHMEVETGTLEATLKTLEDYFGDTLAGYEVRKKL